MKKILKLISNKYLLTVFAFLLLMLFFDQNDWFTQRARQRNLDELNQNIEYLTQGADKMELDLKELNTNPLKLETYAREKYNEKRANEDVYIIKRDTIIEK